MNMNSVWATEKAAPVFRSGFGIIPANLLYCTTARKNFVNTWDYPFTFDLLHSHGRGGGSLDRSC
jgi:hypothetical protein